MKLGCALEEDAKPTTAAGRERSGNYRFTFKNGDPAGHAKLAKYKENVARANKDKPAGEKYRVTVHGRLGPNSPHAHLYKKGGPLHSPSSQRIKPEHAAHFDVYTSKVPETWQQREKRIRTSTRPEDHTEKQHLSRMREMNAQEHERHHHDSLRAVDTHKSYAHYFKSKPEISKIHSDLSDHYSKLAAAHAEHAKLERGYKT